MGLGWLTVILLVLYFVAFFALLSRTERNYGNDRTGNEGFYGIYVPIIGAACGGGLGAGIGTEETGRMAGLVCMIVGMIYMLCREWVLGTKTE